MAVPDVHIHRCDVRLIRSAADGAALMERHDHLAFAKRMQPLVMGMIEQFLAERLAREGGDLDIARLDLALTLPASVQYGALPLARAQIRERIETTVSSAVAKAKAAGHVARRADWAAESHAGAGAAPVTRFADDEILATLAAWLEHRQLAVRLSLLGPVALARLFERAHRALQACGPPLSGASPTLLPKRAGPATQEPAERAAPALRPWIARVAQWVRRRDEEHRANFDPEPREWLLAQARPLLPLALELVRAAQELSPPGSSSTAKLDRVLRPTEPAGRPGSDVRSRQAQTKPQSRRYPMRDARTLQNGRYELSCALPYLALLRLAEHGVLAGLPQDDPALAELVYATALKLQPLAPGPGGLWSDQVTAEAALVAGLSEAPDGAALAEAAGRAEALIDFMSAGVNAAMRPALIDFAAVPAIHASSRVMTFDPVGFYPAGAVPAAALAEILGGRHALLVFPAADTAGLRLAANAGLKAACQGLPAAREKFARIDGPRGWRGMATVPAETLSGHCGLLPLLAERAEQALAIWLELTESRPLAASAAAQRVAPLDRGTALLAGFALADIAYRLSRHDPAGWREPDPLLALERFGDLSARMDVSDSEVAVTLPLGARFGDLFAAGLLDAAPRLPWLGGRVLRVGGG